MDDLGDADVEQHDIPSRWRERTRKFTVETMTVPMEAKSISTQTLEKVDCEVQTDPLEQKFLDASTLDSVSKGQLLEFLKKAIPEMEQELTQNINSHAFDDYSSAFDDDGGNTMGKFLELTHAAVSGEALPASDASDHYSTSPVSAVSWNCAGSVLAVAYGRADHQGWCQHRSALCIWNIMRRSIKTDRADLEIEVPCCMTSCAFHPENPSLIAGGLFTGEVRVWDTSKATGDSDEEMLIMQSGIDDYFHREPVVQVLWIRNMVDRSYSLVTCSGDGKILFWSMKNKLAYPFNGVSLIPTSRYHGQGISSNRFSVMGGTSLSFSPLDYSNFVVGTEAGGVLKGQLKSKQKISDGKYINDQELKWSKDAYLLVEACDPASRFEVKQSVQRYARREGKSKIEIADVFNARPPPTKLFSQASDFAFDPHSGPVYSISFSPFHRNIFLTCSTDGSIRLFNLLRPKPLIILEPTADNYLNAISWSPSRPLVFAAADDAGQIYLYDLKQEMLAPLDVFSCNNDNTSIASLEFNPDDPRLLCSADVRGRISVWKLSKRLSTLQDSEIAILDQMGTAA